MCLIDDECQEESFRFHICEPHYLAWVESQEVAGEPTPSHCKECGAAGELVQQGAVDFSCGSTFDYRGLVQSLICTHKSIVADVVIQIAQWVGTQDTVPLNGRAKEQLQSAILRGDWR